MAQEFARAFYNSRLWIRAREQYIKSVDGLCEDCLAKGIYKPGKIVHHVINLTPENINNPEIALSFDNLRYVCKDCHEAEHSKPTQSRYVFDKSGNLILTEEANEHRR